MFVYFYKYLHKRQQTNSKEQYPSKADSVLACQGIPPHFFGSRIDYHVRSRLSLLQILRQMTQFLVLMSYFLRRI